MVATSAKYRVLFSWFYSALFDISQCFCVLSQVTSFSQKSFLSKFSCVMGDISLIREAKDDIFKETDGWLFPKWKQITTFTKKNPSPTLSDDLSDWLDFRILRDQRHHTSCLCANTFGLKSGKFMVTLQSKQCTLKATEWVENHPWRKRK